LKKYRDYSKESYERLYRDFNLKKTESMEGKIDILWEEFKEEFYSDTKRFYTYYKGEITFIGDLGHAFDFLMSKLNGYYNRNVIVLVDEHDAPVQKMYKDVSFENPSNNKELMKSIKLFSDQITYILSVMAKSNIKLHKCLIFGTSLVTTDRSNFYLLRDNSNWTNVQFFALNEREISLIVDEVFKLDQEHKQKIKKNAKEWYYGYDYSDDEGLYSLSSTIQYLNECHEAFSKLRVERKDDGWIPVPSSYWAKSNSLKILKKSFKLNLGNKFDYFLLDLCFGIPAHYEDRWIFDSPMLENPTYSDKNLMIIFYSLLQGGFLTEDNKGRGYYKIPNKEIRSEFENKLRRHLNSLPFRDQSIPKLFTATKSEDFQTLGEEMTKSLYSLYLALKSDKERPVERSIHNLMLGYLERLTRNGDYVVLHEHREDTSGDK
jgi:hypothetical protein